VNVNPERLSDTFAGLTVFSLLVTVVAIMPSSFQVVTAAQVSAHTVLVLLRRLR
jgi:hypothetical protein